MKKIITLIITVIMLSLLYTNVFAQGEYVYDFVIGETEICVVSSNYLSEEEAYQIALHSITNSEFVNGDKGAWCIVNGHSMQSTTATTIQHKYYSTAPRCLEKTYLVQTCSVCGYTTNTLLSSSRIYCCP